MKSFSKIAFLVGLICLQLTTLGQTDVQFNLNVSKNKLQVGEPFKASIGISYSAETLNGFTKEDIEFPFITDSLQIPKLEIWETSPALDTTDVDNLGNVTFVYKQDFVAAAFDTGTVEIPPFYAVFNGDTVYSNAVSLLVSLVPIDKNGDFKDIKGLEDDPLTFFEKFKIWLKNNWWWLTLVLLSILGVIYFFYWRKNKKDIEPEKPKIPTPERLLYRLNEIDQDKLWQNDQIKRYYSEITEVIDEYLNYRFEIPTFEKTSHEIISALRIKAIDKEDLEQLDKLFFLSDMVKFAKSLPTPEENKEVLIIARELIKKYKAKPQKEIE